MMTDLEFMILGIMMGFTINGLISAILYEKSVTKLKEALWCIKSPPMLEWDYKPVNCRCDVDFDEFEQILENKKIVTPYKRLDVAKDLAPIIKALLGIFEELYDESDNKYKNNLIMLRYYLKEFEEAIVDD